MSSRRLIVRISGPSTEVLDFLRNKEGILYAEILKEQRDSDATTYLIEGQPNIDIRKNLFFAMAEKSWPIVGLESVGMSLEDIFIKLITAKPGKNKAVRLDSAGGEDGQGFDTTGDDTDNTEEQQ